IGLSFGADESGPSPPDQEVTLVTSNGQPAGYSIESNQGWLTATPLTGTTPSGAIAVSVNSGVLSAGQHTGTLTASAGGYGDDTIQVTVDVNGSSSGFQQDPSTGLVSIEVEHFDASTPRSSHEWLATTPSGASDGGAMQALPNNGANLNTGYATSSPQLDFLVNFVASGKHYLWLRGIGSTDSDDSAHAGLDGTTPTSADRITRFGTSWKWTKSTMDGVRATINVPSAGERVLNIWMREDGLILDKIVLTTDPDYKPTANGPPESPR
ncbi:MAG: BACON domain-containing protein, partial [Gammaproteobacteria bacterium]